MADHGAIATASFSMVDCPSTVDVGDLSPVAKTIISRLNESSPDLIVIELETEFSVAIRSNPSSMTLNYERGPLPLSSAFGLCRGVGRHRTAPQTRDRIDVVSGSVTDSQMGEDYIENEFGIALRTPNATVPVSLS